MRETIPESLDGERLDRALSLLTNRTRSSVTKSIVGGAVRLDGLVVTTRSQKLRSGQVLEIEEVNTVSDGLAPDDSVQFEVVFVDEHLVVINKPDGLVVHPGASTKEPTLVEGLLARFPDLAQAFPEDQVRPGIVHRLDVGTTGLLVVARTEACRVGLVEALQERRVHRAYRALLWGEVADRKGLIDAPIGRDSFRRGRMAVRLEGKPARTEYEVLDQSGGSTFVAARLQSGRTHQIRVHFSTLGYPVVGDATYGGVREVLAVSRPMLHAHQLEFVHPITEETHRFVADLPDDMVSVLAKLGYVVA